MTRPTETSPEALRPGESRAPLVSRPDREALGAAAQLMQTERPIDLELLTSVISRAFAQTMHMIHVANSRKDKRAGDPKVGGHPASCASSIHILAALHLVVREPQDFVACKPHASPVDHALHHLLQLFRQEGQDGQAPQWVGFEAAARAMHGLRRFSTPEHPEVFQSYHAKSDFDSFHFLPSGSVGIPPVASAYLSLAYRYAKDHGWELPANPHFWSLIGDSEFREGSLLEVMPECAERQLGNVCWIIDYNRQNLDGTRTSNPTTLHGADCERIERTALANGWRVVQLRHGSFREELFKQEGGAALREVFERAFSDYEYQMLLLKRDAATIRSRAKSRSAQASALLSKLSDADVVRAFADLGGHDVARLVAAYEFAKQPSDQPCMIIAHTVKGWNLACAADPSNHSALPDKQEQQAILTAAGLSWEQPFALFDPASREGRFLAQRRDQFRAGIEAHDRLREQNRALVRAAIERDGGIPESLDIDLSLFPSAHTQWMWGQLAAKLVRIGTSDEGGPHTGPKELSATETRWRTAADFVLTLSPDVGTSTNISGAMDSRIYGPDDQKPLDAELQLKLRHPQLVSHSERWTRHVRFEIAEANAMSAAGSFGALRALTGLPFCPIMTVYDFFVKRALDQLYYNLYWGSEFIVLGTPSGITLSSEGAQHSWKSDIQMPNLVTWEPLFAIEMDWILSDAIRRQMLGLNAGRSGVLLRAVTRAIPQRQLLELLRKHAASKQPGAASAPLAPAGANWVDALDESTLAVREDAELLAELRRNCLAGAYYLVDWRGYAGYEPGDNVVHVFSMGSVATEALEASTLLLQRGIFANVIHVSSPELLLGILGEQSGYEHLCSTLGIDGDLHAVEGAGESEAGLLSLAGRRVPILATCDGEAGLLDNLGSIVGVKQKTLAVRKFSKCGRPDEIYAYHHLDAASIVEAAGELLARTALENLRVSPSALARFQGMPRQRPDWRELWPKNAPEAH